MAKKKAIIEKRKIHEIEIVKKKREIYKLIMTKNEKKEKNDN